MARHSYVNLGPFVRHLSPSPSSLASFTARRFSLSRKFGRKADEKSVIALLKRAPREKERILRFILPSEKNGKSARENEAFVGGVNRQLMIVSRCTN